MLNCAQLLFESKGCGVKTIIHEAGDCSSPPWHLLAYCSGTLHRTFLNIILQLSCWQFLTTSETVI